MLVCKKWRAVKDTKGMCGGTHRSIISPIFGNILTTVVITKREFRDRNWGDTWRARNCNHNCDYKNTAAKARKTQADRGAGVTTKAVFWPFPLSRPRWTSTTTFRQPPPPKPLIPTFLFFVLPIKVILLWHWILALGGNCLQQKNPICTFGFGIKQKAEPKF